MSVYIFVSNDDGTVRAMHCKRGMLLSKDPDGPVTHASVFWYEDTWDESTGAHHIVPIENIFYEQENTEENARPVIIKPEIVISRMTIPEALRNEIFERDGYKCTQCGSVDSLQIDHIQPFSKGGKTVKDNLQTLCKTCNVKKGNRHNG